MGKFVPPVFRGAFGYDPRVVSLETALGCTDPTMAKQSFKEECDINTIIDRFGLAYQTPEGTVAPTYADFSGVVDFTTACNAIAKANESFDALPASVRARFGNDPADFVDFCSLEANREEVRKMGLLRADAAAKPAPGPAPAAPPAPAPTAAPAAPSEPAKGS